MHVAILGTRGIPNYYGGFEQFAENLSLGLIKHNFDVTVYNSHNHPFQGKNWNGVNIVHSNDPEHKFGTIGQFVYDFNCILDCRKKNYDIILQLGYTSSSVWGKLLPRKKSIVTTNMDGLEWKRSKYSKKVQQFLQFAEQLAISTSDHLISDSIGIQNYLKEKYKAESTFIPYGANVFDNPQTQILKQYGVEPYQYNLLIARLEPENSIETILDGVSKSKSEQPFLVIGNNQTKFGNYLINKFKNCSNIKFVGGIYDMAKLNNLRHHSNLYFHGHTVGGTNPSLLEAMASNALICAHNNIFNKSVLGADAFYFKDEEEIVQLLSTSKRDRPDNVNKIEKNIEKIETIYCWPKIIQQYIDLFRSIYSYK
jgi:glycosyltransferase involved in cell wall biosynthesis